MATKDELLKSEEMKDFYRMLARVQTNAIFRIMRGESETDIKKLAKKETMRLREAADGDHKCPAGTVWDETLQRCV